MSKSKTATRSIMAVFVVMLVIFGIAASVFLLKQLISSVWIPVSVTLVMALILALPFMRFWQWLTGISNIPLCIICNLIAVWPVLLSGALIINKCTPRSRPVQTEAVIKRLLIETRYHTKRVSRRVYTRGAPYSAFCAEVTLPGGADRTFDITKKKYDIFSKGDTVLIETTDGMLGMSTMNPSTIRLKDSTARHRRIQDKRKTFRGPKARINSYNYHRQLIRNQSEPDKHD